MLLRVLCPHRAELWSEEMYEEGFHSITNIDISMVVTKAMQEKYRDKASLAGQGG